ncbi:MAG TPA: MarR family transcriptional regulator [Flavobacteriales bacterium]|nr:MarR family transcriptional regulator [Salibacteraceae bacterium]HAS35860.1 MarR family transcriptional regulator [Flavobacteriales bacterium]
MKPEETLDFPIKWAWHHVSRIYNAEATKYGGSMAFGHILLNVDLEQGSPSTSLGPKLGMESTSLSRTIRNMEEKGLIERRPCKDDGRRVFIHLTKFGRESRELAKNTVVQFNEHLRSSMGEKRFDSFLKSMHKINEILSTETFFQNEKTDK